MTDLSDEPGPTNPEQENLSAQVYELITGVFDGAAERKAEYERIKAETTWWIDAADLLSQPDPGPVKWLIEDLIVDQALIAAVGRWKTTKSYLLLDLAISIATGRPALGELQIPEPGPVVFVNEESGRAALWRRLDALTRGRAIPSEELRGQLIVAPNAGVKLDDPRWQNELLDIGYERQPKLYIFDPLARMKAAGRDENEQTQVALLIDFIRTLREETGSAVAFVHHQGHSGDHMRGSSDLESFWETRLTFKREGQSPQITIETEHREAETQDPLTYEINWHTETRTIRFDLIRDERLAELTERVLSYLTNIGPGTTDDIRKAVETRRTDVLHTLERLAEQNQVQTGPSGRRDGTGRPIHDKVWQLSNQAQISPVPNTGRTRTDHENNDTGTLVRPNAPPHTPLRGMGSGTEHARPANDPDADIPF